MSTLHRPLQFTKLKQKKLQGILALCLVSVFLSLGCWQFSRMKTKELWAETLAQVQTQGQVQAQTVLSMDDLQKISQHRFQPLTVKGFFLEDWHLLLDNQLYLGQAGYRVFSPFVLKTKNQIILVDRGWIPLQGQERSELPEISAPFGEMDLTGFINQPNQGILLKEEFLQQGRSIRLQHIDYQNLSKYFNLEILPFVLQLQEKNHLAFQMPPLNFESQIKKHMGYAVQWWVMAIAVIFYYFFALLRKK